MLPLAFAYAAAARRARRAAAAVVAAAAACRRGRAASPFRRPACCSTSSRRRRRRRARPWWLLLLRLLLAALVILAAAGPVWNPPPAAPAGGAVRWCWWSTMAGPRAASWERRMASGRGASIAEAEAAGRGIAVVPTAEPLREASVRTPSDGAGAPARAEAAALHARPPRRSCRRWRSCSAQPATPALVWLSDAADTGDGAAFVAELAPRRRRAGRSTVLAGGLPPARALAGGGQRRRRPQRHRAARRRRRASRAASCAPSTSRACRSARRPSPSPGGALETNARVRPAGRDPQRHRPAGDRRRALRRRGAAARRALAAAPRRPRHRRDRRHRPAAAGRRLTISAAPSSPSPTCGAPSAPRRARRSDRFVDMGLPLIVLADIGTLAGEARDSADRAGSRPAACWCASPARGSPPAPTSCCRCGCGPAGACSAARSPGSSRSTLGGFAEDGPFAGLAVPERRHGHAAGAGRARRPAVRAHLGGAGRRHAAGHRRAGAARASIVLFHVTADTSWSDLPLSGIFVEMLRRIVALAGSGTGGAGRGRRPRRAAARRVDRAAAAPARRLRRLPAARPRRPSRCRPASRAAAPPTIRRASTAPPRRWWRSTRWRRRTALAPLDLAPLGAAVEAYRAGDPIDLRRHVLACAFGLFLLDALVVLADGRRPRAAQAPRGGPRWRSSRPRWRCAGLGHARIAAAARLAEAAAPARTPPSADDFAIDAVAKTRLAYVVTGDAEVDELVARRARRAVALPRPAHRARVRPSRSASIRRATSWRSSRCSTGR